jgi:hypothetical protein
MNERSSPTVAPASTELTTPAKSTQKPTTAIAAAASQAEREASVPRQTNTAPTAANAACACSRLRIGPPNSTSSTSANEPNAAKVATVGLPITFVPSANMPGITTAARAALRVAESPGSCARIQRSGCTSIVAIGARSSRSATGRANGSDRPGLRRAGACS